MHGQQNIKSCQYGYLQITTFDFAENFMWPSLGFLAKVTGEVLKSHCAMH